MDESEYFRAAAVESLGGLMIDKGGREVGITLKTTGNEPITFVFQTITLGTMLPFILQTVRKARQQAGVGREAFVMATGANVVADRKNELLQINFTLEGDAELSIDIGSDGGELLYEALGEALGRAKKKRPPKKSQH